MFLTLVLFSPNRDTHAWWNLTNRFIAVDESIVAIFDRLSEAFLLVKELHEPFSFIWLRSIEHLFLILHSAELFKRVQIVDCLTFIHPHIYNDF